jgi:hypothetical protein
MQVQTRVVAVAHPDFAFDARPFNGVVPTWFHSPRKIGVPPTRNPLGHGHGTRRRPPVVTRGAARSAALLTCYACDEITADNR